MRAIGGTNQSWCEEDNPYSDILNCTWDPWMNNQMYYPNGSLAPSGGCVMDWSGGGGGWGGVSEGCWQHDANKLLAMLKVEPVNGL